MSTITLEVPDDIAESFRRASESEQAQMVAKVTSWIRSGGKAERVEAIIADLDCLGSVSASNGMTDEIFSEIYEELCAKS